MSLSSVNQSDARIEEVQQALAYMVCYESNVPSKCCIESPGFKLLTEACNPHMLPHLDFQSLKRNCLKLYDKEHDQVQETFSKLGSRIILSVDFYVYQQNLVFPDEHLCLSAHFIDDDWDFKKWVIHHCVEDDQTPAQQIEATLQSIRDWNIERKVSSLTVRCEDGVAAKVKEHVQRSRELPLSGKLFHVQCCSDMISQMIQKGFTMIDDIIVKVQYFTCGLSRHSWHLTSSELRDALQLKEQGKIPSVPKQYRLSKGEWVKVRKVYKMVNRIYEILESLFEVQKPTSNLFLPHLIEVRAYLIQEAISSDLFVKALAQKMLKKFNKYWKDMYLLLAITAFMDPRYKMKLVEFSSIKLADGDVNAAYVLASIRNLYEGYMVQNDPMENAKLMNHSDSEDEAMSGTFANLNILGDYVCSMQSVQQKSDLDLYLEEPVLPWTENFSVLKWWKKNCFKYPQLSRMARDYLAIPMSVATGNQAYSTEHREADKTLRSVEPELKKALMCTRSWKFGYGKIKQAVRNMEMSKDQG